MFTRLVSITLVVFTFKTLVMSVQSLPINNVIPTVHDGDFIYSINDFSDAAIHSNTNRKYIPALPVVLTSYFKHLFSTTAEISNSQVKSDNDVHFYLDPRQNSNIVNNLDKSNNNNKNNSNNNEIIIKMISSNRENFLMNKLREAYNYLSNKESAINYYNKNVTYAIHIPVPHGNMEVTTTIQAPIDSRQFVVGVLLTFIVVFLVFFSGNKNKKYPVDFFDQSLLSEEEEDDDVDNDDVYVFDDQDGIKDYYQYAFEKSIIDSKPNKILA